jgi:threonyl-tRNA synthetase
MKITLADETVKEFDGAMTVSEIAKSIAISLGKQTIAAKINDNILIPASSVVKKDCRIEFITVKNKLEKQIAAYTAGLLTHDALRLNFDLSAVLVEAKEDGSFYILIDTDRSFNKDDLEKIEKVANEKTKTLKIVNTEKAFSDSEFAMNIFNRYVQLNPEYTSLVKKINHLALEAFYVSDFPDRPFLPSFAFYEDCSKVKKIKLTAASTFQFEEGGKTYQQIRGVAASNAEYVDEYLRKEEERKKSDHRYIGKQLEIFTLDPLIGRGLPIWLPNGTIVKDEIKKYLKEKEWEYDFIQIQTPVIGTVDLYKTSGHWDHYREDMFAPMELPQEEVVLKPMSCPHHIAVYNFKPRSYRELPLRLAEHALQYRYESSGSLTGLERVRAMELTDSHIFCATSQIKDEFKRAFKLIQEVLDTFHISIDYLSLSVRDPKDKEKYFDDDKMWNNAEAQLQEVLDELGVDYIRMPGEAAFYGPKLDIQAKTVLGHEITVSTLQLDFLLPMKFDLTFVDKNGATSRPIMIHRGLIGTYERFISVLLEQTGGVLPLWLAPKQVEIIPVNVEEHTGYCEEIKAVFKKNMIRSSIDERDERLNYKIREAQVNKVPYTLVIGNDERNNKSVTFRPYGLPDQVTMSLDEFLTKLKAEISERK